MYDTFYIDKSTGEVVENTRVTANMSQEQIATELQRFLSLPRVISKLSVRRKLRAMGKETPYDQFLSGLSTEAKKDFDEAQELNSNDPIFTAHAPVFKQALNLTDDQFNSLLY